MKKHTMQEIADFLGMYVAKDKDGEVFAYEEKPERLSGFWDAKYPSDWVIHFSRKVLSENKQHNWKVLVSPKKEGK